MILTISQHTPRRASDAVLGLAPSVYSFMFVNWRRWKVARYIAKRLQGNPFGDVAFIDVGNQFYGL